MSVSPPSGSASTDRMQLRTLCLAPGLRLSDRIELKADHLGRSRTIDLGAQRPTHATSFHGTIQTVAAGVKIDPATGQALRRIDHADSVARHDAQQVSLVVSFPASCTHADRPGHPTQVTRGCCLLRFAPRVQRRAHIRPFWAAFRTGCATTSPREVIHRSAPSGPRYHKVIYDRHVASVPITTRLRAEAALLASAPNTYVSHFTAATLWGGIVPHWRACRNPMSTSSSASLTVVG
jgi:hypothetical protein